MSDAVILAKLLSDVIISATLTLKRVQEMSAEEVKSAIVDAETMLDVTRKKYAERDRT